MEPIVIDTDVWSYLFKGDTRAQQYLPHLEGNVVCLSFQTVAELRYWAAFRGWGETRMGDLALALERFTILHSDNATVEYWAQIRAHRARIGHPMSAQDAWIAATALRHQAKLLTHNPADYGDIANLFIIDPGSK